VSNEAISVLPSLPSIPALSALPIVPGVRSEVRIWVDDDDDADRVGAVLEALGYTVLRELDEGEGSTRLRWAVARLTRQHKLTAREQDILERVLAGSNNREIASALEISRATVKWHMHNIFAKTNTGNRESLLRLALQIGGVRASVGGPELGADDRIGDPDAPRVRQADLRTEPHVVSFEPIPAAMVPSKPW
jgi:DNA-binding CsgD family transcriptional regulator